MQPQPSIFVLIGRFLGLSLLGFVFLSFSGVLLGLFLPFAVGYGVYTLYRYYRTGEAPPLQQQVVEPARQVATVACKSGCGYLGSFFRALGSLFSFTGRMIAGVFSFTATLLGGSFTLLSEVIAGTILGAALGVLIGMPTQTDRYLVFVGAGGGALLGLFNAFGSFRANRRLAQLKKLELAVARG
ncbi:MAG TPA: hypothetical protein PKA06_08350 [Gemmatales bacterium]|nr:hypothetical protein [Gemmatales bacterium]HMP18393.1 hypothetical protein [Gemmatales bacterium]